MVAQIHGIELLSFHCIIGPFADRKLWIVKTLYLIKRAQQIFFLYSIAIHDCQFEFPAHRNPFVTLICISELIRENLQ